MDSFITATAMAAEAGWSDETLLDVVIDFVELTGNGDELIVYLSERIDQENGE